jgi:hypothetical protein
VLNICSKHNFLASKYCTGLKFYKNFIASLITIVSIFSFFDINFAHLFP